MSMAKSLLLQLLSLNEALDPYYYNSASISGEACLISESFAIDLLKIALNSVDRIQIMLDGLDECDRKEKRRIITWLKELVNPCDEADSSTIKCLLVSQDDNDFGKWLSSFPTVRIEKEDNLQDITVFCNSFEASLKEKFTLSDEEAKNACQLVIERADGK
jgi:hypothetical protein